MKYMQTGGFQSHPLMRLTLYWTLAFLSGLWVTNAAMYLTRMGLAPASVQEYYRGSGAEFSAPRSFASMLEVSHAHLPIMGVVALLLTHLMIFAPYRERTRRAIIHATFLSALAGEGAGWLVRFAHPGFAVLKIGAFLAFQGLLAWLIIGLAVFLAHGAPPGRRPRK